MTNLERAQTFAIEHCLSDYPPNATYEEICDWIANDTDDDETGEPMVTVWEAFEYQDVLVIMDDLVVSIKKLLDEVSNDD